MEERKTREPCWPGRPILRRLIRARLVKNLDYVPCMLERQENDQHHRREIVWDEDQIHDHSIDQKDRDLINAPGKSFTHPHGKSTYAFGLIIVVLIDVLGNVDAGNPQSIGD